ncbi:hypothetical protein CH063_09252 [Colletotrichum higginsianum]|uniref:EC51 protein n=2 Tax=Colletotrichum higginsianum TaxID=80884 RepID=H1VCV7_COLHI|nr:EC51 protein [Colletotrichum higginsianum IMI 349063]OBR06305.1 EC51 protein [Colletotrichum higginsianum IMI 349063]TIC97922.1 hypothetical protein CH35J_007252 [Colletotrichum higginsianum]CCF38060.1 hypothetical protein CH063_09252 [Colletotrichum higginsianum]
MKLLYLFTYFSMIAALAILSSPIHTDHTGIEVRKQPNRSSPKTPDTKADDTKADDPKKADKEKADKEKADKEKPDPSKAWKSIEHFFPSGSPQHNTYYWFTTCIAQGDNREPGDSGGEPDEVEDWSIAETGCAHIGIVVGKTARRKKEFKATLIDLVEFDTPEGKESLGYRFIEWGNPINKQKLRYGGKNKAKAEGGKTTKAKADITKLKAHAKSWLDEKGKEYNMEANCLTFYWYIKSLLQ